MYSNGVVFLESRIAIIKQIIDFKITKVFMDLLLKINNQCKQT